MVRAMDNGQLIDAYAELLVRVGVNLQVGQLLTINAFVEHAPLTRRVARAAYEAGASYVDVRYSDDLVKRAMIEHAPQESLDYAPPWLIERVNSTGEQEGAALVLSGEPAPGIFSDLDGKRVGAARMSALTEAWLHQVTARRVSWFAAGPQPDPLALVPVEQMKRKCDAPPSPPRVAACIPFARVSAFATPFTAAPPPKTA